MAECFDDRFLLARHNASDARRRRLTLFFSLRAFDPSRPPPTCKRNEPYSSKPSKMTPFERAAPPTHFTTILHLHKFQIPTDAQDDHFSQSHAPSLSVLCLSCAERPTPIHLLTPPWNDTLQPRSPKNCYRERERERERAKYKPKRN